MMRIKPTIEQEADASLESMKRYPPQLLGPDDLVDPNAKYRAEFAANPMLAKLMTEADYVSTRRIDDGLDSLGMPGLATS